MGWGAGGGGGVLRCAFYSPYRFTGVHFSKESYRVSWGPCSPKNIHRHRFTGVHFFKVFYKLHIFLGSMFPQQYSPPQIHRGPFFKRKLQRFLGSMFPQQYSPPQIHSGPFFKRKLQRFLESVSWGPCSPKNIHRHRFTVAQWISPFLHFCFGRGPS